MFRANKIHPDEWKAVEDAVLCFVRDRNLGRLLLIHKKTGLGAGLINAPGGRIEKGEDPPQAAIRETQEEVGLTLKSVNHRGDLYFQFVDGHSIRGYVYETDEWTGDPRETNEANPFWCDEGSIPYEKMWTDDSWWLPHLIEGRKFRGRFLFDGESMLSMSLDVEGNGEVGIPRNGFSAEGV